MNPHRVSSLYVLPLSLCPVHDKRKKTYFLLVTLKAELQGHSCLQQRFVPLLELKLLLRSIFWVCIIAKAFTLMMITRVCNHHERHKVLQEFVCFIHIFETYTRKNYWIESLGVLLSHCSRDMIVSVLSQGHVNGKRNLIVVLFLFTRRYPGHF